VEVRLDLLGTTLSAPQVAPEITHHLPLITRAPSTQGVGLDILIEQLIGVEIGAVPGEEIEVNLLTMLSHPSIHALGPVPGITGGVPRRP